MINNKFKIKKVFDVQDMPKDLTHSFLRLQDYETASKDCYVDYYVDTTNNKLKPINDWFIENGASNKETIIVKYWW